MKSATIKDPLVPNPKLTAMAGKDNPYLESAWPVSFMEPFLRQADPLADSIIEMLYAEGRKEADAAGDPSLRPKYAFLFLSLLINRMSIPDPDVEYPFASQGSKYQFSESVCEALRTFIQKAQKLPVWADSQLIRDGQKLFANNPLLAYPMLAFLSLPVLYTCGRGATQVLSLTEQISLKVRRRVVETGSLVMQAMQEGSFVKMPEHPTLTHPVPVGIEAILRVRLLHAATRTIIHEFWQDGIRDRSQNKEVRTYQNKPADKIWQESWGLPINQQYLAGTLMSFSFLDLYGLETLGVIATPEEKRGYMHVWNVFGSILGIDEAFLKRLESPNDFASSHAKRGTAEEMVACGQALLTRMTELNRAYDQEGIEGGRMLTAAIITYISGVIRRYLPILSRTIRVDHLPHLLMSLLLSEDDRALLGIKVTWVDRIFYPIVLLVLRLRGIIAKTVGLPASVLIANVLFKYMQKENDEVYDELAKQTGVRYPGIPLEFQKKWGVEHVGVS